jgi:menaquinone-dependent protoporphyrinogen oxidase
VYSGLWLGAARAFARRHVAALRTRPVWLFSSGPIGPPAHPTAQPVRLGPELQGLRPGDHHVFGGRLDRRRLTLAESAVAAAALRVPDHDDREWHPVIEWVDGIVDQLAAGAAEPPR